MSMTSNVQIERILNNKVTLNFRLPATIVNQLSELAEQHNVKKSDVIAFALKRLVADLEASTPHQNENQEMAAA